RSESCTQFFPYITLFRSLQKAVTYKGKVYGIPRAFSSQTLIYRSDLIEDPPETWDELVETAKRVQEENEGMYGFGISGEKHVTTDRKSTRLNSSHVKISY